MAQKWALMAWTASLCWPIAALLMEKRGLRRRDLKALIKYRMLMPWKYLESLPTFLIGTLLLVSLAANLASPLLTGSIYWVPRNTPIRSLSTNPIPFLVAEGAPGLVAPNLFFDFYMESQTWRQELAQRGGSLVGIAWDRSVDRGAFKRVSNFVEPLAINSTIETVVLPYFATHSIEWIRNKSDLPPYVRNVHPEQAMNRSLDLSPAGTATLYVGGALLVPDLTNPTNWSSDTWVSRTIHDRQLLIYNFGTPGGQNVTQRLPSDIYVYTDTAIAGFWAFAWVTFSAGAGTCRDYQCVISSRSTIRNNTPIELEPHPYTFQALSMATTIAATLVQQNTSIPYSWGNHDDFINELLVRSYSGAWNAIMSIVPESRTPSNYRPALSGLAAEVRKIRVYGWLGLQLSVTLLSIVFLVLQVKLSKFPLLGEVGLVSFYMDTSSLPERSRPCDSVNGVLKIHEEDDMLKVKVV
ncbi:hypothetical protein BN14_03743 [Rhizoctonia solani AG-1 IB]|uniref:Uncharacterized protein n=1 Tax=Thanatephorus cucumeris (strain AG1-IB / isolate 7/3/14) TaxID=1108050 RepID=M5BR80_THACB|nr:hypothetical protein BN14_03743 [Rhizoctonia solani AG-1 IB]